RDNLGRRDVPDEADAVAAAGAQRPGLGPVARHDEPQPGALARVERDVDALLARQAGSDERVLAVRGGRARRERALDLGHDVDGDVADRRAEGPQALD